MRGKGEENTVMYGIRVPFLRLWQGGFEGEVVTKQVRWVVEAILKRDSW